MTIGNVGASDLVWDIEEAAPIEIPASNGDFPRGKAAPSFARAPEESMATVAAGEPNLLVRLPGTFAFSTDASVSTHIYFDSDTPGTLNTLGPATSYFWAGDFVGGDLTKTYVIRDTSTLMTVDAATGAETSIGTLATPPGGETYTGMTFDPSTGNVYATSCNITTSSLFTIDVTTATATRIGAITNSPCSIGIGANDSGNLYTYDLVNDSLLSINKSTGAGTIIGSIGFDANYGQGMDFDSVTGTMYMAAFNNGTFLAELRAVDLATGNTTLLGVLGTPGTQLGYVAFQSGGPCSSPSDLPWLSVNPTAGTTIPGGTNPVDVTFDSTGIAVGTYDGVLCVNSNDPDEPIVEVPVQMEVVIPVELMGISIE
jgi:DNA-binding beta-propeller fold protein YncE